MPGDGNGDGLDGLFVASGFCKYEAISIEDEFACSWNSYVIFGKVDGEPVELASVEAGMSGFVIGRLVRPLAFLARGRERFVIDAPPSQEHPNPKTL